MEGSKPVYWVCFLMAGLFIGYALLCSPKALKGDFSSFWLGAWWVREKPAETPALYYPFEDRGTPNLRIWTMIRKSSRELFQPWHDWGKKHDFKEPKFYLYPPVFAVIFVPLTFLKAGTAAAVWNLINALSLILALFFFASLLKSRNISFEKWLAPLFAVFFISYPVTWSLELGQNSLFLFLGWVLLFIFLCKKEEIKAGIILGMLISVKINPVVLIPWMLWRRFYKSVLVCAATLMFLAVVSVAAAGFENIKVYFLHLFPLLSTGTHFYENQSLLGVLLRWKNPLQIITAPPGIADPSAGLWYPLLGIVLLGIESAGILITARPSIFILGVEFLGWLAWLAILSPVTWSHHQVVLLLIPFFLLKIYLEDNMFISRAILFWVCLGSLLIIFPTSSSDWLQSHSGPAWVSFHFLGAVILWVILQILKFSLPKAEAGMPLKLRSSE